METLLRLTLIFVLISTQLSIFAQDLRTFEAPVPCVDKTFTIVAHIVRDSFGMANVEEQDILDALESADSMFNPICVNFEICEFRYIDNFQYDFIDGNDWEEMQVQFHVARRINMFFVDDFETNDVNACGFAGLGQIVNLESDGIVVKKNECMTARTIAHELGHYFGLMHTFEGSGDELVNGSNCETAGDLICDTPSDPYIINDPIESYIDVGEGCRFINERLDANGQYYSPHVGNVMSYYPEECGCGFTSEQFRLMANTYLASPHMW